MKQYTNESQTAKLIELGFEKPKNTRYIQRAKARNLHSPFVEFEEPEFEGSYSIGELVAFCPPLINRNRFGTATINIFNDGINWVVGYDDVNGVMRLTTVDVELIDALCTMCRKLKEEGVI